MTTQRNVNVNLTSDEADLLQGLLKASGAFGQLEQKVSSVDRKQKEYDRNKKKLIGTVSALAGGMLGAQGLVQGFQNYTAALDQASRRNRQFETEITGLISLGSNVQQIGNLKNQVLTLSNATGLGTGQIADAMFAIQSSAGNLSKVIQNDILANSSDLTKLTGTELPASIRLLTKTYQTYGDQVSSVTDASNKLIIAAEQGDITFQQLALRFPEVASAAKGVGINFTEVLGALVALTQKSGDTDAAFTSLRNIILSLENAYNQGLLENTGDFIKNIEAINTLNSENLLKIFGKENLAGAKSLAESTSVIASSMKDIQSTAGNIAKEKTLERLRDPAFKAASDAASVEQIINNSDLNTPAAIKRAEADNQYKLEMNALKRATHPALRDNEYFMLIRYGLQKSAQGYGRLGGKYIGSDEIARRDLEQAQMDAGTFQSKGTKSLYESEAEKTMLQAKLRSGQGLTDKQRKRAQALGLIPPDSPVLSMASDSQTMGHWMNVTRDHSIAENRRMKEEQDRIYSLAREGKGLNYAEAKAYSETGVLPSRFNLTTPEAEKKDAASDAPSGPSAFEIGQMPKAQFDFMNSIGGFQRDAMGALEAAKRQANPLVVNYFAQANFASTDEAARMTNARAGNQIPSL